MFIIFFLFLVSTFYFYFFFIFDGLTICHPSPTTSYPSPVTHHPPPAEKSCRTKSYPAQTCCFFDVPFAITVDVFLPWAELFKAGLR